MSPAMKLVMDMSEVEMRAVLLKLADDQATGQLTVSAIVDVLDATRVPQE